MALQLENCVVMVTGGASGLGEATVKHCVKIGAKVAILDLNAEAGIKLSQEIGEKAYFFEANITDEKIVRNAITKIIQTFGEIHVLVNSAGIALPQKVLTKDSVHLLEIFNEVIQVNLVGTFNVLRLVAEKMALNKPTVEGERGVIINTASVAAFEGQIGQAAYSASKGGLISMTLPIARKLAVYGIRVVTIAPGAFQTPLFSLLPQEVINRIIETTPFPKRMGYPEEYAKLVQSIVENPMLNGTTIRLDGSIRMGPK